MDLHVCKQQSEFSPGDCFGKEIKRLVEAQQKRSDISLNSKNRRKIAIDINSVRTATIVHARGT